MRKIITVFFLLAFAISFGQSKAQWKTRFDAYWDYGPMSWTYVNKSFMTSMATSNGEQQEHYYMAWAVHGANCAFMATGDTKYLNDVLTAVYQIIGTSKVVPISGGTFYGWPGVKGENAPQGQALWESYLWRHITTLMRVMYQSPTLRAMNNGALAGTTYQDNYDYILGWLEHNIWDKWTAAGIGNMYRINTHMASHWARIGMELFTITGEQKYLDIFNNIMWAGIPTRNNKSIRSNIYNIGTAYSWYQDWNIPNTQLQDTNHGSDVVDNIGVAAEQGYYWTALDMQKFANGFKNLIWTSNSPVRYAYNVNGSGGMTADVDLGSWLSLGMFDSDLMARINTYFYPNIQGGNYAEGAGVMLYNTAYWENSIVYPENNDSGGGTPPADITPPVVTSQNTEELTETGFKIRWYLDEPSKGWIVFGTSSDTSIPYTYTYETAHENGFYPTHGQGPGFSPNTGITLTPGTKYYYRFYVEDVAGNSGYSAQYEITTLGAGTPVLSLVGDETINKVVGEDYIELGATCDDGSGSCSGSITIGGDTVDKDAMGTYVISYSKTGATTIYRTVIYSTPVKVNVGKGVNFNILLTLKNMN